MGLNIFYCLPLFKNLLLRWNKKYLTWIKCWGPPSIADGRFERVFSQNFFRNRQISSEISETSSTCILDPNASLGPKTPKIPTQEPPQKWFSFRKWDERGWKSALSNLLLKEASYRIALRSFCHLNWPYSTCFVILAIFFLNLVC